MFDQRAVKNVVLRLLAVSSVIILLPSWHTCITTSPFDSLCNFNWFTIYDGGCDIPTTFRQICFWFFSVSGYLRVVVRRMCMTGSHQKLTLNLKQRPSAQHHHPQDSKWASGRHATGGKRSLQTTVSSCNKKKQQKKHKINKIIRRKKATRHSPAWQVHTHKDTKWVFSSFVLVFLSTARLSDVQQRSSDNTPVPDQKRTMLVLWSSWRLRLNYTGKIKSFEIRKVSHIYSLNQQLRGGFVLSGDVTAINSTETNEGENSGRGHFSCNKRDSAAWLKTQTARQISKKRLAL